MAALLLARRGVDVTLLEMHKDFDRDFRGDTVHASTLEVLDQIGLAEPLHALPHAKMRSITLHTPKRRIVAGELRTSEDALSLRDDHAAGRFSRLPDGARSRRIRTFTCA